MARRRMFTLDIVDTDNFLDMPCSAQALYFHLGMRADDDGFVGNAKKIMYFCGAKEDDLRILNAKGYVIRFESGIYVVAHWGKHNNIPKDRYHETDYRQEKSMLNYDKKTRVYTLYEKCIQNDNNLNTQDSIGENRDSITNNVCLVPACKNEQTQQIESISFILRDGSEWIPEESDIDGWIKAYKDVDVYQQLKMMEQWTISNPDKRKTKRGIRRFCTSWLNREQQKRAQLKTSNYAPKQNQFTAFQQNEYDFDELENDLINQ